MLKPEAGGQACQAVAVSGTVAQFDIQAVFPAGKLKIEFIGRCNKRAGQLAIDENPGRIMKLGECKAVHSVSVNIEFRGIMCFAGIGSVAKLTKITGS